MLDPAIDLAGPAVHTMVSWLGTYFVHSTVLVGGVWAFARFLPLDALTRSLLWKMSLVGGLFTATLQTGLGVEPLLGSVSVETGAAALETERPMLSAPPLAETPAPEAPMFGACDDCEATVVVMAEAGVTVLAAPLPTQVEPALWATALLAPPPPPPLATAMAAPGTETAAPAVTEAPAPAGAVGTTAWVLAGLFVVGAAASLARLGITVRRLRRGLRGRVALSQGPLRERLTRLLARVCVPEDSVRLTMSERVGSPVALASREIVVPERAHALAPRQQEAMLAHELAHVLRRDPAWQVLAAVIEAALFFQPLNRVARRGMQEAAEELCDDWAVRHTGSGLHLARCLTEVASWPGREDMSEQLASPMAGRSSLLVRRVTRLLDAKERERGRWARRWRGLLGAGLLIMVGLGAPGLSLSIARAQTPEPPPGPPEVPPPLMPEPVFPVAPPAPPAQPLPPSNGEVPPSAQESPQTPAALSVAPPEAPPTAPGSAARPGSAMLPAPPVPPVAASRAGSARPPAPPPVAAVSRSGSVMPPPVPSVAAASRSGSAMPPAPPPVPSVAAAGPGSATPPTPPRVPLVAGTPSGPKSGMPPAPPPVPRVAVGSKSGMPPAPPSVPPVPLVSTETGSAASPLAPAAPLAPPVPGSAVRSASSPAGSPTPPAPPSGSVTLGKRSLAPPALPPAIMVGTAEEPAAVVLALAPANAGRKSGRERRAERFERDAEKLRERARKLQSSPAPTATPDAVELRGLERLSREERRLAPELHDLERAAAAIARQAKKLDAAKLEQLKGRAEALARRASQLSPEQLQVLARRAETVAEEFEAKLEHLDLAGLADALEGLDVDRFVDEVEREVERSLQASRREGGPASREGRTGRHKGAQARKAGAAALRAGEAVRVAVEEALRDGVIDAAEQRRIEELTEKAAQAGN